MGSCFPLPLARQRSVPILLLLLLLFVCPNVNFLERADGEIVYVHALLREELIGLNVHFGDGLGGWRGCGYRRNAIGHNIIDWFRCKKAKNSSNCYPSVISNRNMMIPKFLMLKCIFNHVNKLICRRR